MKKNNKIIKLISKVVENSKLPKNFNEIKLNCVDEWDSMGNMNILLEIEKEFNIKFSLKEISTISSYNEIVKSLIKRKINVD